MSIEKGEPRNALQSLQWILKSLKLIRQHVQKYHLIDIGVCRTVTIVRTNDETAENPFDPWNNLTTHVTRGQVPRNEFIGNRNYVSEVSREAVTKYSKLMSF